MSIWGTENLVSGGSNYPGVVTDLIREVRDAGRIRDESLMNRVKALIEEKSWTANESTMRILRELEEVKVSFCVGGSRRVTSTSILGASAQPQTRAANDQRPTRQARGGSARNQIIPRCQQQSIPAIPSRFQFQSCHERSAEAQQHEPQLRRHKQQRRRVREL